MATLILTGSLLSTDVNTPNPCNQTAICTAARNPQTATAKTPIMRSTFLLLHCGTAATLHAAHNKWHPETRPDQIRMRNRTE